MNQTDIINIAKEFFEKSLPGNQDLNDWIQDSILKSPGIKEHDCFDKASFLLGLSMGSIFVLERVNSMINNRFR